MSEPTITTRGGIDEQGVRCVQVGITRENGDTLWTAMTPEVARKLARKIMEDAAFADTVVADD